MYKDSFDLSHSYNESSILPPISIGYSRDLGHIDHIIICLTTPLFFPRAPHMQLHHIRSSASDLRAFQPG